MKIRILGLFFGLLLLSGCESKVEENENKVGGGIGVNGLKNFSLTTMQNNAIDITLTSQTIFAKEFQDKILLVNFWAPWCEPCKKEMPDFVKLQKKYEKDFIVLGVLFDSQTSQEDVNNFLEEYNINFPVTKGEENFKFAKAFDDVQMIPESFLYSKDGVFIKKFIGILDYEKLEESIKENL